MLKDHDYKKDKSIQFNRLHINAREQASVFGEYGEGSATAELESENADAAVEEEKAQRYQIIAGAPADYGLQKTTETAINSVIYTEQGYLDKSKKARQAKYTSNRFKRALRAFEHRKSMIEVLSRLHSSGYFSAPRIEDETIQTLVDKENDSEYRKTIDNKGLVTKLKQQQQNKEE